MTNLNRRDPFDLADDASNWRESPDETTAVAVTELAGNDRHTLPVSGAGCSCGRWVYNPARAGTPHQQWMLHVADARAATFGYATGVEAA